MRRGFSYTTVLFLQSSYLINVKNPLSSQFSYKNPFFVMYTLKSHPFWGVTPNQWMFVNSLFTA